MPDKKPIRKVKQRAIADETYLPKPYIPSIVETVPRITAQSKIKSKYKTLPGITINAKTKKKSSGEIETKNFNPSYETYAPSGTYRTVRNDVTTEEQAKKYNEQKQKKKKESEQQVKKAKNVLKKVTAVGQFAPTPYIKYPSMALNAYLSADDAYNSYNEGDNVNAAINAAGIIPWGAIPKFGVYGLGAEAVSAAADLTDNFGLEQQKNGGTSSKTVTCTCGHSWDKSDSSKKDATVCHICGKDNVMKNGGWLDKYSDSDIIPQAQKGEKVIIDGKEYDTSSDEYRNLYRFGPNDDGKGGVGYYDEEGRLVSGKTTLPEIVVFSKDKDTQKFYDKLEDNDQYAFEQMVKKYGPVNITKNKGTGIFSNTEGHYNPLTNQITINPNKKNPQHDTDAYLSELAHKVQFDRRGNFDAMGNWVFNDFPDYAKIGYYNLKDYFNIGDADENMESISNSSPYKDPSTVEYEAHSVIEPALRDEFFTYSTDDVMGDNYNKFKSGGKLDNYGEEINANEGSSSAPKEWMGEGYSNVGRNYSPAWGGQFQGGGSIGTNPEDLDIKEIDAWEKAYTNSPRFAELSRKQGDSPEMTQNRIGAINTFNINKDIIRIPEGASNVNDGKFYLSPEKGDWPNYSDINAHEFGHLPYNTENLNFPKNIFEEIQFRNKEFQKMKKTGKVNENIEHDIHPNEVRADKNQLLFQLQKLGIYDATKDGDIKQEQLDKFKKSGEWNRLQRLYSDEDILWLINNVAKNDSGVSNTAKMGASIPGSVGFMYARTNSPAPSEGPYAKKTMPSAQNGQEMSYYQNGLDWKPKSISKNGGWLDKYGPGGETKSTPKCGPNQIYLEGTGCIDIASPMYRELYESGKLVQQLPDGKVVFPTMKPFVVNSKLTEDQKRELLRKDMLEAFQSNQNQTSIGPATEQSWYERAFDIATHPGTAIRAYNKKGYVPNNLGAVADDIGGSSSIINTLSPFTWAKGAYNAGKQFGSAPVQTTKDVLQGAGNLVGYGIHSIDRALPGQTKPEYISPFGDAGTNARALEFVQNVGEASPLLEFAPYLKFTPYLNRAINLSKETGLLSKVGNFIKPSAPTYLGEAVSESKLLSRYNPITKADEFYTANVADRLVPGRSFEDVSHKMSNLRKDLGISRAEDFLYKRIPKLGPKIPLDQGKGILFDAETGQLFDSNTRYWLNRQYGHTPSINELLEPRGLISKFESIGQSPKQSSLFGNSEMFTNPKQYFTKPSGGPTYNPNYESIKNAISQGRDPLAETLSFGTYTPAPRVLDWKKVGETAAGVGIGSGLISGALNQKKEGGVVKDNNGYWNPDNWGKVVEIDSPNITMQGVNQDLIGISDEGDVQYMEPGKDYKFKGNKVKEYPVAQDGNEISSTGEVTYTHEPGQRGAYRLQRTVTPYTSNRDIKKYTQAPTDPRQVNFLQNYAGAISGYQDDPDFNYPTQVPYEGAKHWNVDRFIIDPQFSSRNITNKESLEQNRANVLADMYKYYMLQDPEHKGKAFRKAKRFVHREIDPKIEGPFLQSYNTVGTENPDYFQQGYQGPENFTNQNSLKDLYTREMLDETGQQKVTQEEIDKLKNVSFDYFKNYKGMSKKQAKEQWKKWEEEAAAAKGNFNYQKANQRSSTNNNVGWNVEYKDASGKSATKHFDNNEDAEEFYNKTSGEKAKYSDVSSVGRFKYGGIKDASQLTKLDQLTNFTNYNKPTKGGWLDKYN